jgi:hypothetical protein
VVEETQIGQICPELVVWLWCSHELILIPIDQYMECEPIGKCKHLT